MRRLKRADDYLKSVSVFKFILIMLALTYFLVIPLMIIVELLFGFTDMGGVAIEKEENLILAFIFVAILGPMIETFIFQSLIITLLRKMNFFRKHVLWAVILSAMAFGASHHYSVEYVIFGTLMGVILAYAYCVYIEKPHSQYWVVTAIHGLRNGIAFFVALAMTT